MGVPKKKTSKTRTRTRRAHHALKPINLVTCTHCKSPTVPHRVCPVCGYYKNKEVIKIKIPKEKKKKKEE